MDKGEGEGDEEGNHSTYKIGRIIVRTWINVAKIVTRIFCMKFFNYSFYKFLNFLFNGILYILLNNFRITLNIS